VSYQCSVVRVLVRESGLQVIVQRAGRVTASKDYCRVCNNSFYGKQNFSMR
jgi:hypothetical protein